MTNDSIWTRIPAGMLAGVAIVGLPLISAGLFSSSLTHDADTPGATFNTQNMQLLTASINQDPKAAYEGSGGGNIEIVQGRALLASSGPSGTLADIEEPASSNRISVYVVREGDTLSQISEMFGVTTNTILWANDLGRNGLIKPGQTLVILPISGVRHEVESGDTLKGIAKKYDGDLDEIMVYNDLDEDATLVAGDIVIVPDGEVAQPVSVPVAPSSPSYAGGTPSAGYYIRPSAGTKTQGIHGYNSIDIGHYYGSPIVASASGKVIVSKSSGYNGGYGVYVVIEHSNGSQTLYAHNSQNIVYAGQSVVQGQVIAYMGSSGNSTGPHVHFEIRNGPRNPF